MAGKRSLDQWVDLCAPLLFLLVTIALLAPVVAGDHSFFRDDFAWQAYEWREHERVWLLSGRWPLWDAWRFCGMPFLANIQTGVLYPVNWLSVLTTTERFMTLTTVLHLWLACQGIYRLCRFHRLPPVAALGGALAYGLGSPMLVEVPHNSLQVQAWVPWLLLAWSAGSMAWSALLLALMVLAGFPQFVLMFGFVWAVCALVGAPRRATVVQVVACSVLALGLAAAQVVPFLELAGLSSRSAGNTDTLNGQYPLMAAHVHQMFLPELHLGPAEVGYAATPYYVPTVEVLLLLAGLLALRRRDFPWRGPVATLACLVLFAVLAGLGPAFIFGRLLLKVVPGYHLLRVPVRWVCVALSCTALIAAAGLSRMRPTLAWSAVALLLVNLAWLGRPTVGKYMVPTSEVQAPAVYRDLHAVVKPGDRVFFSPYLPGQCWNWPLVDGLQTATGYDPIALKTYVDFLAYALQGKPLDEARERYLFETSNVFPWQPLNPRFLELLQVVGIVSSPSPDAAPVLRQSAVRTPHAWFVSRAESGEDEKSAYQRLLDPTFDASTTVLLDGPLPPMGAGRPAVVESIEYTAEAQTWRVQTDHPGVLVVKDAWYPGWQARIDGDAVPIQRAYWLLRAVAVPAGDHRVTFRYKPRSLAVGIGLTAVSGVAWLLLLESERRRRRRPASV